MKRSKPKRTAVDYLAAYLAQRDGHSSETLTAQNATKYILEAVSLLAKIDTWRTL